MKAVAQHETVRGPRWLLLEDMKRKTYDRAPKTHREQCDPLTDTSYTVGAH